MTRAKEKVKKAFLRRSRSSRSSSSSRDNMSVDSSHLSHASREEEEIPAVPRSRFRIRILMMVMQIVYKNDYERAASTRAAEEANLCPCQEVRNLLPHHDGTLTRHEPSLHCRRMGELHRHHRARFASLDHGISYASYR